jgi:hypothetical protein
MHLGLMLKSVGWIGSVVGLAGGNGAMLFGLVLKSAGWIGSVVGLVVDRGAILFGLVSTKLFC